MDDEGRLNLDLNEVWRVCRKIQSGIFKYGFNLWNYFKPHDPNNNGLISESKFGNILGQLKNIIGLSEFEIKEVTDYFRLPDGRVTYDQFCQVVCEEGQDHSKNEDYVSGLEWDDPMHVNVISATEQRRLCILLTKVAQSVRLKDIVLMPYFQDYELVARNVGTVTVAHFSRVLHFLGILLSEDDFLLLLKRYMKNSYTVNYVAFVKHIEEIVKYLDAHRLMDYSQDVIENFPGRLIDAELPKLPRPEIGKVNIAQVFGIESSFHSCFNTKKESRRAEEIILRIKRHINENRIRLHEFFDAFDPLKCGYITKNQFLRCLDSVGVSGIHRLYLTEDELYIICKMYEHEFDVDRVNWRRFEEDIDSVFTIKDLDKKPYMIVQCPPKEVVEIEKEGHANWHQQKPETRNLCEEALYKCQIKINTRRLYLHQFFRDYDKLNIGHVSRSQARQVIFSNGILLSNEEFYALEKRYNDDLGFNYAWFLEEADPAEYAIPKFKEQDEPGKTIHAEKCLKGRKRNQQDVILALANVKRQAVTKRVRIVDFLKTFDPHRKEFVSETDFRRGLDMANIKLSQSEVDLICDLFKAPLRKGCINYKQFCKVIEEVFYQNCLERAPLIVPLQHFPCTECYECFLNFDERTIASKALQKLARKPDQVCNLSSLFQDYDRANCGTIPQNQFLRALTLRGLIQLISSREFETICKCFGVERGLRLEVDYRAFLSVLDILFANKHKYPF